MSFIKAYNHFRKGQEEMCKEKGGKVQKMVEAIAEVQATISAILNLVTVPVKPFKKTRIKEHKNQQVFDWQKDWIRKEREVN